MTYRGWRLDKQLLDLLRDPREEYSAEEIRLLAGIGYSSNAHRFIGRMLELGVLDRVRTHGPRNHPEYVYRKLVQLIKAVRAGEA